jgi:hypothetical protein
MEERLRRWLRAKEFLGRGWPSTEKSQVLTE